MMSNLEHHWESTDLHDRAPIQGKQVNRANEREILEDQCGQDEWKLEIFIEQSMEAQCLVDKPKRSSKNIKTDNSQQMLIPCIEMKWH